MIRRATLAAGAAALLSALASGCSGDASGQGRSAGAGATTAGATSASSSSGSSGGSSSPANGSGSGSHTGPTYRVSGWLPYWRWSAGDQTIAANVGHGLDEVNLFGYALQADGSIVARNGVEDAQRMARIESLGGEVIPTVVDVHDDTVLAQVLQDPAAQDRAVTEIVAAIHAHDFDGIDVDFEHASEHDRGAFSRFVGAIGQRVRARGKAFSVTIPGKRSDRPSWAGYDYAALAAAADRVKVMCYGYSGTWSSAGPIAPVHWIEEVLDYAVTTMPRDKIHVGVPFYGYDWPANGGRVRSVTSWSAFQSRLAQSAGGATLDPTHEEVTFDYTDSNGVAHTVWYPDGRAIAAKARVVERYGVAGLSIWALGYGDDRHWDAIRNELGTR